MKPIHAYASIAISAALSSPAIADTSDYGNGVENFKPAQYLTNKDGRHDHWLGIGQYNSPAYGYCTTFLIDTGSTLPSDPVYALTSAHCVNKENGAMSVDEPIEGSITFNFFIDRTEDYMAFPLKRVVWSSIQGVDLALLELEATQGEMRAQGIIPMKLAQQAPAEDADILVVHAAGTLPLQISACTHAPSSALFEKPWVWRHSVSNQCKGIKPGSSGSPVIIRATNEVYAVLGTRAEDLTPLTGYDSSPGANYGSPTSVFKPCFSGGTLNADPATCELFPTASIKLPDRFDHYAKIDINAAGEPKLPSFEFELTATTSFIRTKITNDPGKCESPDNYGPPFTPDSNRLNIQIGPQTGLNNLCLIATDSDEELLPAGTYRNAVTVPTYLHPAGPTPAPAVNFVFNKTTNRVAFEWPQRNAEGIESYQAKSGLTGSVNCEDPQGYSKVNFNWLRRESNFPMTLCTYAYDANNQRSALTQYTLEWETLKGSAP
ncbi:trypsin-like peptidase domain-containing protein [Pseudomonas koreensis]|uniref:trypsin-like peptidase domain-containing protein n=1 Tax=Pseudomonas koreensis TaxID=198620 RepID=UPI003207E894